MFVDFVSYICPSCGQQRWKQVRSANSKDRVAKFGLLLTPTPICGVCVLKSTEWLLVNDGTNKEALDNASKV